MRNGSRPRFGVECDDGADGTTRSDTESDGFRASGRIATGRIAGSSPAGISDPGAASMEVNADEARRRVRERGRDGSRLAVHAGRWDRPVPGDRDGRRLVLREGARAAARRPAVCGHRTRRDPLRLPQLRLERRGPSPAHRSQRPDRGLPQRHLVRRDARRDRLGADRRLGAFLQRGTRPRRRCDRPACEMCLGADSGRRRLPEHAARPRNDRLPQVRAASHRRPAPALPHAARTGSCLTLRPIRRPRSRPGRSPRRTRRSSS